MSIPQEAADRATELAKACMIRGYIQGLEHALFAFENLRSPKAIDLINRMIEIKRKELEP